MAKNDEKLTQLKMLHEHIKQVRSHMGTLEKQITDLGAVHESLEELKEVKDNNEILLQLAGGVFAPAIIKSTKELCVNIGAGIVVSKSIDDTQKIVKKQMDDLHGVHVELQVQFDGFVRNFQALQKDLQGEEDV